MKIVPLQDRVLVKRLEEDGKSAGGIIIPDSAKEKPQRGTIMAVGPGKVLDSGAKVELTVKEGNTVLFGKYSGSEVTLNGEEILIMREDDILGIIV